MSFSNHILFNKGYCSFFTPYLISLRKRAGIFYTFGESTIDSQDMMITGNRKTEELKWSIGLVLHSDTVAEEHVALFFLFSFFNNSKFSSIGYLNASRSDVAAKGYNLDI